jgi:hypothetical protein
MSTLMLISTFESDSKYIDKSPLVRERFTWLSQRQGKPSFQEFLKFPMGKINGGKTIGTISLFFCITL